MVYIIPQHDEIVQYIYIYRLHIYIYTVNMYFWYKQTN